MPYGKYYGDLVVLEPATCDSDGYKAKICSLCGNEADLEIIPSRVSKLENIIAELGDLEYINNLLSQILGLRADTLAKTGIIAGLNREVSDLKLDTLRLFNQVTTLVVSRCFKNNRCMLLNLCKI